jgi:MYXO-CTERM domain-containing protein
MAHRLAFIPLWLVVLTAPLQATQITSINPAYGTDPFGRRNPSQGGYFSSPIYGVPTVAGDNQFTNQDLRYGAQTGRPDTNLINLTLQATDLHKPIDAIFTIKASHDPLGIDTDRTDWLVTVKVINDVEPLHPIQNVRFELFEPDFTDLTAENINYKPYLGPRELFNNDAATPEVGLRDDFDVLFDNSGITLHEPMFNGNRGNRGSGYPSSSYNTAYSDEHFPDWNTNPGGRTSLEFGGLLGGGGDLYYGETGVFTFGLTLPADAFSNGPSTQYFGLRVTANPEPTSLALAGFGMAAAGAIGARRRRRSSRQRNQAPETSEGS